MGNCNGDRAVYLDAGGQAPKEKALREKELLLLYVLSQTDPQTLFGAYVQGALKDGKFESLVGELKDQARDAHQGLARVLGEVVVRVINEL
jgi:hypothetical protein